MTASAPGRPTILDVARAAGVSKSTVSRVLTDDASVAPATRARVNAAMDSVGYTRGYLGRALRTGRTSTMGLIVPDLSNPVYSTIASAAQDKLFSEGYLLLLGTCGSDLERQHGMVRNFISRGTEAIAITPLTEQDEELTSLLDTVPTVLLDREHPDGLADTVTCAHGDALTQALRHLAATNHDVVTIIDRPSISYPGRSSAAAVAKFAETTDMTIRHLPTSVLDSNEAYDALVATSVGAGTRPAVVATSGPLMFGALRALGVLGLKPAVDVSFIGTDDSPIAAIFEPPLTALYRDLTLIGESLATLLLEHGGGSDGQRTPRRIHVPMRLIWRASVLHG